MRTICAWCEPNWKLSVKAGENVSHGACAMHSAVQQFNAIWLRAFEKAFAALPEREKFKLASASDFADNNFT